MPQAKTRPTSASVQALLAGDPARRTDADQLLALMARVAGAPPVLWGTGIVGFGQYHYRYASGHAGDAPLLGFALRKGEIVLYLSGGDEREALLARLGKHRAGKGCVYIKRLADVDAAALEALAQRTVADLRARYPA